MDSAEIIIPAIPAGVTLLLNFFAPYATAFVINPRWTDAQKKIVAIVVSLVLATVVLLIAFLGFGLEVPAWPVLLLVGVLVSQSSYDLVTGTSADRVARTAGTGKQVAQ